MTIFIINISASSVVVFYIAVPSFVKLQYSYQMESGQYVESKPSILQRLLDKMQLNNLEVSELFDMGRDELLAFLSGLGFNLVERVRIKSTKPTAGTIAKQTCVI